MEINVESYLEEIENYFNIKNYLNMRNKINYEIGVPLKYLTNAILKNKKKLIEICKKYAQQSELEKDLDDKILSFFEEKDNSFKKKE